MTNKASLLIALSLVASSSASASDNRVRTLPYEAEEIVGIVGYAGIQSTIQFGIDERIENIAVGNSLAWQVTPNRRGSLLFVKPLTAAGRTNMTVVTDKRTYMFDLRMGGKSGAPLYVLKFSYPDVSLPAAETGAQPPVVMASASLSPVAPMTPERLNFNWKVKGSGGLRPARIFDDGLSLYLSWSSDTQLPAILTAAEKGREAPLDYRVAGEFIVITPVPQNIVLRYGKNAATAWRTRQTTASGAPPANPKPKPDPDAQESGTVASDTRFAIRTPLASGGPQQQTDLIAGPRLADTNSVRAPDAAILLSDNLTDGHHDH